jgi:hypothetical protein
MVPSVAVYLQFNSIAKQIINSFFYLILTKNNCLLHRFVLVDGKLTYSRSPYSPVPQPPPSFLLIYLFVTGAACVAVVFIFILFYLSLSGAHS